MTGGADDPQLEAAGDTEVADSVPASCVDASNLVLLSTFINELQVLWHYISGLHHLWTPKTALWTMICAWCLPPPNSTHIYVLKLTDEYKYVDLTV